MLKLASHTRGFATPVRCPACRYPNLAIDIWCERCGRPLDWKRTVEAPAETRPLAPAVEAPPAATPIAYCPNCGAPNLVSDKYCPRCGSAMSRTPGAAAAAAPARRGRRRRVTRLPRLRWPALTLPKLPQPRLVMPRFSPPGRLPRVPGIALVIAAVLAVALIVPLAYARLPAGHPVAARQAAGTRLPSAGGASAASTPQAAAIAGVEAKTGLRYATKCPTNAACLSLVSETAGKNAAVFVFSTARSGGRQCAGYVFHGGGGWHLVDAACGLPDQLSPLVGRDATVRVPGSCANVRETASLTGRVVACINDGTAVHIDGGPTYADGRLWWHEKLGWMAHDFLVGP